MKLSNTNPSRTMSAVENMLVSAFCAVPAPSRVEPAMTSGPVAATTRCSTARPSAESAIPTKPTVSAPVRCASCTTPTVNALAPLADTPSTTSAFCQTKNRGRRHFRMRHRLRLGFRARD